MNPKELGEVLDKLRKALGQNAVVLLGLPSKGGCNILDIKVLPPKEKSKLGGKKYPPAKEIQYIG